MNSRWRRCAKRHRSSRDRSSRIGSATRKRLPRARIMTVIGSLIMVRRRDFLAGAAGLASLTLTRRLALGKAALGPKERVDRALKGADVDRPPFSFWHHFGLKTPEDHATATLKFHRQFRTDFVKVMSDFPYPKGTGSSWYELKPVANPFPQQIRALELVRDGLNG